MSYTYLATDRANFPLCAFSRKHELEQWCRREKMNGFPYGGWASLYRVYSEPWESESRVVELVYRDGWLIEKAAG